MREIININKDWSFRKLGLDAALEKVNIPHTWNNLDGQDGGGDYYRGRCLYEKQLKDLKYEKGKSVYIEFQGVNQTAEIYLNDKFVGKHEGGYSTFRFDITSYLDRDKTNCLQVYVDNSKSDSVYPQVADFTFFGGIYRDVNLIIADKTRFSLDYFGGQGVEVTPKFKDEKWLIEMIPYITNVNGNTSVKWTVYNSEGIYVASAVGRTDRVVMQINNPVLWNGVYNPYMYTVTAELFNGDLKCDEVSVKIGLRTFSVNKDEGFILNGKSYPLRGVSRHQDRKDKGYAIGNAEHEEDMRLIQEIGANTVRLAHYQHAQYFYDLCDNAGMVVWAEVPYISEHLKDGCDNIAMQLQEIIVQNYHHPSICFWGISNEITLRGVTDDIVKCHERLLNIVKQDDTRLSTMAHVFMLDPTDKFVGMTDICAYNHYFGWYVGNVEQYEDWFKDFREKRPELCVGLSEYGADGMPEYQTAHPETGDYTETYQAYYHEKVVEQIDRMRFLWCTYVWNMFDFGCDSRNEAGQPGQNHKGLVTYDRKIKKDAFYVYKAYWSKQPFVHIAGKRYVYRSENKTQIKVYSNLNEISLYVDGELIESKSGKYVFTFNISITGKHTVRAVSGKCEDSFEVEYVEKPYKPYICGDGSGGSVGNWFDEGLSVKSKIKDIVKYEGGEAFLRGLIAKMQARRKGSDAPSAQGMDPIKMLADFRLEKLLNMGGGLSDSEIKELDNKLKQLKKI